MKGTLTAAVAAACLLAVLHGAAGSSLRPSGGRQLRPASSEPAPLRRMYQTLLSTFNPAAGPAQAAAEHAHSRLGFVVEAAPAPRALDEPTEEMGGEETLPHSSTLDEAVAFYAPKSPLKRAAETAEVVVTDGERAYTLRPSLESDMAVARLMSSGRGTRTAFVETEAGAASKTAKVLNFGQKWKLLKEEDTARAPSRMVGRLWMSKGDRQGGRCTGTLVGKRSVLTAAHCFVSRDGKDVVKAQNIHFVPGSASDVDFRFGSYTAKTAAYPKAYPKKGNAMRLDLGVLCLAKDTTPKVGGFLPLRKRLLSTTDDGLAMQLDMYSYPGAPYTGDFQLHDRCRALYAKNDEWAAHFCDSRPGSSGAAMLLKNAGGEPSVIGVHRAAGKTRANFYVQFGQVQYDFVRNAVAACEAS